METFCFKILKIHLMPCQRKICNLKMLLLLERKMKKTCSSHLNKTGKKLEKLVWNYWTLKKILHATLVTSLKTERKVKCSNNV